MSDKGTAYGVGVGPGDPELMTLKAVRIIRSCAVVAVPGDVVAQSLAYQIAVAAVPDLSAKCLVALPSPMMRDRAAVEYQHVQNAHLLETYLRDGKDVAYLTLGDPCVYSTFTYLQKALEADGVHVELVSGVPSFCAAAARLGMPLSIGDEELRVLPTSPARGELARKGTSVYMKAGSGMSALKDFLRASGCRAQAVERCGLDGERVYRSLDEIPDDASYFTLVIARGDSVFCYNP